MLLSDMNSIQVYQLCVDIDLIGVESMFELTLMTGA